MILTISGMVFFLWKSLRPREKGGAMVFHIKLFKLMDDGIVSDRNLFSVLFNVHANVMFIFIHGSLPQIYVQHGCNDVSNYL